MKRFSSLLKACTLVFFVFFFVSKSVSSVSAVSYAGSQSPCGGSGCQCPAGVSNCKITKYRCDNLTNGTGCSQNVIFGPASTSVAIYNDYGNACGTVLVTMTYTDANGKSVSGYSSKQYPAACGSSGQLPDCAQTGGVGALVCPVGQCETGKIYCKNPDGSPATYVKCAVGNLGCSLNGCNGQMSYCNNGSFSCKADAACVGVTAPVSGTVGSCDGCSNDVSCAGRKGTYAASSQTFHPECAAQGGYCSGTTYCGGGSTTTAPVTGNLSCGDKCTTSAECRNPSANGAPVACVNGTCQNTMCAAGQTIPGANCSCGTNTRKCGQTCNGTVGLCGPGQGSCTYVNSPKHWYTGQPDCAFGSTTYCANTKNGYSKPTCITGDAPGGQYLVAPNGATTGITVAQMQASCQVCGNGEVEVGEQCDDGALNGTAGSSCTADSCMKVTCNQACTTDASCGVMQRTVKLVVKTNGAAVDYVLDNGVYAEVSPALVPAGTWTTATDTAAHGGSYLSSIVAGASVTYKTYAPSIKLMLNTAGAYKAGWVDVYIDGTLKKTLAITPGWKEITLDVAAPSQYSCVGTGTAKTCRLTANPGSATCVAPAATATPTPVVAPVCSMAVTYSSNANKDVWKIGDQITFTLGSAATAGIPSTSKVRYDGQVAVYRGSTLVSTVNLVPINDSASQFQPMTVNAVNANYYFRFRYCTVDLNAVETCSPWGAWTVPAASNVKVVKFVNLIMDSGKRPNMAFDAIKENGVYIQNNSSRISFSGTWSLASDSNPLGGNYSITTTQDGAFTISTTASILYYRTYIWNERSDVGVFVNGVFKTRLSNLNVGSVGGWVDLPVQL